MPPNLSISTAPPKGDAGEGPSIERVFLGWATPLLPLAARFLAERYGSGGALDLRATVAVVSGGRAGRRLKELLLEEATRRGLRLVPPRLVTAGALAEHLYLPEWPTGGSFLLRQVWTAVLRDASRTLLETLFGEVPAADDLLGWSGLAARVADIQREVAGGGHTFHSVAEACTAGADLLFDDSLRWRALAELQSDYARRLRPLHLSDPDLERIRALRTGDIAALPRLWLVGVAELPAAMAAMLRSGRGSVGALIHAPPNEGGAFDELGLVRREAWLERPVPVGDTAIRTAERPQDQAAEVLRVMGELGAVPSDEVVVATTADELVPYLQEWLQAAGVATHHGGGTPLRQTGPYRLLQVVADYLTDQEWEHFAALIRHPDLEEWLRRQSGGARDLAPDAVDGLFAEHLPATVRAGGGGGRGFAALAARLNESRLLGRFGGARPLPDWAEAVLAFLGEVYSAEPVTEDTPLIDALEAIRTVALAMHRLPRALGVACSAPVAIRLLLAELNSARVAEEAEGAPVELLGWLEIPSDDASHVVVVGVNEGRLPQSLSADAFLPDRLRTALGLVDNAARYARDAFHLTALLHSRRSVNLVCGRVDGQGDPLRPSRLLLSARGDELARRVVAFVEGAAPGYGFEAPLVGLAGPHSRFLLPPEPLLRFDPPSTISVTAFRQILQDPYRFVLERLLRLGDAHDEAREMDGMAFGSLAHLVLQRFGGSELRHSTAAGEIAAALSALLDEEVESRFGADSFPAVQIQVEQLRLRLRRFAEWQARWRAKGWSIVFIEGEASGQPGLGAGAGVAAPLEVDGVPIELRGRIDRVDHHASTGRWAVLDYKTSDIPEGPRESHRQGADWRDLQLPLYRHLARSLADERGQPLIPPGAEPDLGYIILPRAPDQVGERLAGWTSEELLEADEVARDIVRWLRDGVARFAAEPAGRWGSDPYTGLLGLRQLVAAGGDEGELGEGDS